MSANASDATQAAANQPAQSLSPDAAQTPNKGVPKKITNAQTVCNEKNAKGKLCNGHLKQARTGGEDAEKHLRGDDVLFKCQSCGALYMGPPLGHVRDPFKQQRFVERELAALLQAAGGTLPAIVKNEKGAYVLAEAGHAHAPAAAPAAPAKAKPATPAPAEMKAAPAAEAVSKPAPAAAKTAAPAAAKPAESKAPVGYVPPPAPGPVAGETPEQKLARLKAIVAEAKRRKAAAEAGEVIPEEAAPPTSPSVPVTSGTDSSAQADAHRPAAEAQAATGQASAAPLSPAAATASPAAGPETVEDLAPEAATAPAPAESATRKGADGLNRAAFDTGPLPGETEGEKIARLKLVVNAARERAGKPP
ncbi:MAG TPA: hypothetical protein VF507_00670, partial [Pyrinomonadaceae bacterium]